AVGAGTLDPVEKAATWTKVGVVAPTGPARAATMSRAGPGDRIPVGMVRREAPPGTPLAFEARLALCVTRDTVLRGRRSWTGCAARQASGRDPCARTTGRDRARRTRSRTRTASSRRRSPPIAAPRRAGIGPGGLRSP